MNKFLTISLLLIPLIINANLRANCVPATNEDEENQKIKKMRDCRIYRMKLTEENDADKNKDELERISKTLGETKRNFEYDTDKSISDNQFLIGKNQKKIKDNTKLLKLVDEDLAKLEDAHAKLLQYSKDTNDLQNKAIIQNLNNIVKIKDDIKKNVDDISKNNENIKKNQEQINKNFLELSETIVAEEKDRKEEVKILKEDFKKEVGKIYDAIESKLKNVCDSLKYCAAKNADIRGVESGPNDLINYYAHAGQDNSSRSYSNNDIPNYLPFSEQKSTTSGY